MALFKNDYSVSHRNGSNLGYQKFVVITHGRSGSSLLISLLASHNDVIAFAEIFHKDHTWFGYDGYPDRHSKAWLTYRNENVEAFLNQMVFRGYADNISAVGFKLFYNEPFCDPHAVLRYLYDISDLKVIFMKRRNLLRSYVSAKIAMANNVWRIEDSKKENDSLKVEVDVNDCLFYFRSMLKYNSKYERVFQHKSKMEIFYEDLSCNTFGVSQEIQNFLGVECVTLSSKMMKQNNSSLQELIANYDEIRTRLKDTEFEKFFYES